jgi:hypothetical protein
MFDVAKMFEDFFGEIGRKLRQEGCKEVGYYVRKADDTVIIVPLWEHIEAESFSSEQRVDCVWVFDEVDVEAACAGGFHMVGSSKDIKHLESRKRVKFLSDIDPSIVKAI